MGPTWNHGWQNLVLGQRFDANPTDLIVGFDRFY